MSDFTADVGIRIGRRNLLKASGAAGLFFAFGGANVFAQSAKKLNVAMTADMVTLYPHIETVVGVDVFRHLFDTLTVMNVDGSVGPRLATEWQTSDNTVWTFKLNPTATWSDGQPVTAEDVATTYNFVLKDKSLANNAYLSGVVSAEAVDAHTLRITLKSADATFLRWATLIHILPAKVTGNISPEAFTNAPIGSGPYTLKSFRRDRIELAARADYRDGAPAIAELNFISVPSESARITGLRSGELDVISNVSPAELAGLKANTAVKVLSQANNRTVYLSFNTENGPLKDERVRRAITLSIDAPAIAEQALEGLGAPIGQAAAPAVFGHSQKPELTPVKMDADAAQALLKEAGYDGEEIILTYPTTGLPQASLVAEVLSSFLSGVGLKVRLEGLEWATIVQRWRAKDFKHILLFGFGPSILDSSQILNSLYITGSRGFFTSPEIDQVYEAQKAETDDAARMALFEKVWLIDKQNTLNTWLYNEFDAYAIRSEVTWSARPDRRVYFWDANTAG